MIKQIWMYQLKSENIFQAKNGGTPIRWSHYVFPAEDDSDAIDQAQKQIGRMLRLKKHYGQIRKAALAKTLCKRYNERTGIRGIYLITIASWGENGTRNRGENG